MRTLRILMHAVCVVAALAALVLLERESASIVEHLLSPGMPSDHQMRTLGFEMGFVDFPSLWFAASR